MRRPRVWTAVQVVVGVLTILQASLIFAAEDTAELSYSPKVQVRFSGGYLLNNGTSGGASTSLAGINLGYLHYPTQLFAIGIGYKVEFDFAQKTLPVYGFDLSTRFYFYGSGTRTRLSSDHSRSRFLSRWGIYAGPELSQRFYYLGSNSSIITNVDLRGSYFSINGAIGIEHRFSEHFEWVGEGNFGLITFAGSDDRFRVQGFLIQGGISYIW